VLNNKEVVIEYELVISDGTLWSAEGSMEADLGIQDGKIAAIGANLSGRQCFSAAGKWVLPGAIDPHVHLEMPTPAATSSDDWSSGTRAAACGGTTTVIDFIEPDPGESLREAFEKRRAQAEGRTVVDFGLHMTLDRADAEILGEIPAIIQAGVTSFKCYTTYAMRLEDAQLLDALQTVGKAGGLTIVHAENDAIVNHLRAAYLRAGCTAPKYHPLSRPAAAEGEAVERVLALAETAQAPVYIVHVSTQRGAEAIRRAQARQQHAYGETCPQYLVLTDRSYAAPGFEGAKFICSPPLRKHSDQEALWQALADSALEAVGTDHCPFFFQGMKDLGRPAHDPPPFTQVPGGLPGIEARLALLFTFGVRTGRLSPQQWIAACSSGPARRFGLYPRKGTLTVGGDADIVIFDPQREITLSTEVLHENVDYTPYEGLALKGYPTATFLQGQVIVQDGQFIGREPGGKFIPRKIFSK
jgi:dihydropyrimidinase